MLGLEVVLADGSIARLGGRTHKNKTGFDLTRLLVGSEGMLGVVTEATLKLLPLPPFRACLAVGFASTRDAARAIRAILAAGFLPCALEVADAFTLAAARERTKSNRLSGCRGHVIVELDGQENPSAAKSAPSKKSSPAAALCSSNSASATRNAKPSGNSAANSPTPCATPASPN